MSLIIIMLSVLFVLAVVVLVVGMSGGGAPRPVLCGDRMRKIIEHSAAEGAEIPGEEDYDRPYRVIKRVGYVFVAIIAAGLGLFLYGYADAASDKRDGVLVNPLFFIAKYPQMNLISRFGYKYYIRTNTDFRFNQKTEK